MFLKNLVILIFNKYTCYGCGEQGHIKSACPNYEVKEKADFKKEKKGKTKKA